MPHACRVGEHLGAVGAFDALPAPAQGLLIGLLATLAEYERELIMMRTFSIGRATTYRALKHEGAVAAS